MQGKAAFESNYRDGVEESGVQRAQRSMVDLNIYLLDIQFVVLEACACCYIWFICGCD